MNFEKAFELLIGNEGKLSLDPKDRGNWTSGKVGVGELRGSKYGISAMSYPLLDIKNLKLSDAHAIYRNDYWHPLFDHLPDDIIFDVFDTSVNSGMSRAVKLLQKSVGANEDGLLGPQTVALSKAATNLSSRFNAHRLIFMTNTSMWESQGKGWARRIAHNLLLNKA